MNEENHIYELDLSKEFKDHVEKHRISGRIKIIVKITTLLEELTEHPYTGTGRPEPLTFDRKREWSRRITQKHRLIYQVHDNIVTVSVLSAFGHYNDK